MIKLARDIWKIHFPKPRAPPVMARVHKGSQQGSKNGYSGFLRKRRAEVRELRSLPSVSVDDATTLAVSHTSGNWTLSMQKEVTFQRMRVVRAAAETTLQGAAIESERSAFADVAEEHARKRARNLHDRCLAESRKLKALEPMRAIVFGGKPIYVDDACFGCQPGMLSDSDVASVVWRHGMDHLIEMPFAAANGIIVVRDPAAPGRTNLWIAILTGCACVSGVLHGVRCAW